MGKSIQDMIGTGERVHFTNETVKANPAIRRWIDKMVRNGTVSVQFDYSYPKPVKFWIHTYFTQCAA